jgi:hypothetical protein
MSGEIFLGASFPVPEDPEDPEDQLPLSLALVQSTGSDSEEKSVFMQNHHHSPTVYPTAQACKQNAGRVFIIRLNQTILSPG